MVIARERARALGGIEKTNTYARLYLALIGQVPGTRCRRFQSNSCCLPQMAADQFVCGLVVDPIDGRALAIINHYKPTRTFLKNGGFVNFISDPTKVPKLHAKGLKRFFILFDRILKSC